MRQRSREEILAVFKLCDEGRSRELDFDTRLYFSDFFGHASANEGKLFGTRFRRAYQPAFEMDHIAHEGKRDFAVYDAVELRSLLRLDLGDGKELLTPSEGLISAILEISSGALDHADLMAVREAAQISRKAEKAVRINFNSKGTPQFVADAIKREKNARLVAGIILQEADDVEAVVNKWAPPLSNAGAAFAFSNVSSGGQLAAVAHASRRVGVTPRVADLNLALGQALGAQGPAGRKAVETTAGILNIAKEHGVAVAITADVGTFAARKALYEAADLARFSLKNLHIAGRDLMPEILSLQGELPEPKIDLSTGRNLEPAVVTPAL